MTDLLVPIIVPWTVPTSFSLQTNIFKINFSLKFITVICNKMSNFLPYTHHYAALFNDKNANYMI